MSRTRKAEARERIFGRDGHRCVYCARTFPPEQLTLDHVEPQLRGGDHSDGNLVAACRECNALKASQPAWAYLAERPVERANFLRIAAEVWPRLRRAVRDAAREERRPRAGADERCPTPPDL